jgi:hypothetical protein
MWLSAQARVTRPNVKTTVEVAAHDTGRWASWGPISCAADTHASRCGKFTHQAGVASEVD